jgi:competence protein ComEC
LLTWSKDIRHHENWFGEYYRAGDIVKAVLQEPPVEKANSFKALATVSAIKMNDESIRTDGQAIIYFQKDSTTSSLDYGSEIIFSLPLQEIKNAGNPGGFDYKRYCLFQGITHQVYLKKGDFVALNKKHQNLYGRILFPLQRKILSILRKNIDGQKEYGLAEALLIGYKDDLDKDLVQSYTNTGVVHIIAISGMHIALIYWLLALLCRPLRKLKYSKWLTAFIIIAGLWLFSLLAGGQASVLRSALMFTFIVIGNNFSRKASIYNTLAASAFLLLCYDPFWLWDVGFQLSYTAVLSIVIFMKPIYNLVYIKNKILDFIWKMNAVSIAAQLLTTPFSLYHFHQFPNYFLLTNFVAVPLSSIIVLGEIFLCAVCFIPFPTFISGKILSWLIWLMNSYIERIEALPYSLWDSLQINILQAVFLIIIIAGFGFWLLEKRKAGMWIGLASLVSFVILRSISFYRADHQQKLIVYSIPKHQAIDIIDKRNYFFIGDSDLLIDDFLKNFHLKPSRILHRTKPGSRSSDLLCDKNFIQYGSRKILLIDKDLSFDPSAEKFSIDLLIISKRAKIYLRRLYETFKIKQVVFDGSVSSSKIKYWEKDCDSLHIPFYDVTEKGAFVMNMN